MGVDIIVNCIVDETGGVRECRGELGKKSLPLTLNQNPSPAISYTLSRSFILARVYPEQSRCRARVSVATADDWRRTKERVWDAAAEVELWWGPRGASLHAPAFHSPPGVQHHLRGSCPSLRHPSTLPRDAAFSLLRSLSRASLWKEATDYTYTRYRCSRAGQTIRNRSQDRTGAHRNEDIVTERDRFLDTFHTIVVRELHYLSNDDIVVWDPIITQ